MVSVSSAATAGSLPLMLWHFGLATPISVLANCLLIPLAFVVLATACVSLLFASAHLGYALVLANNANWLFARLMLGGAVMFSKVPGAYFTVEPSASAVGRPPIELTVLNLPYGEAAQHLRIADSHWLLDAGSKRAFGHIVQPLLQQAGADSLSGIVLSHSDIEHVGGAIRASSEHDCRLACVSILEPWRFESSASGLKRFLAAQEADNAPVRFLAEGDEVELGPRAMASVLYPPKQHLHDKGDDRALVLLIELDGFRILWCNDAGFITEKALMGRHLLKSLRCDVLIRNQHATDYSALPEFLLAARPRIIVTSNVPFLAEQTMPRSVADHARKKRTTLLDQDVEGAVIISVEGDRLTASGFVTGHSVTIHRRK
jgi:competence protein ComEC